MFMFLKVVTFKHYKSPQKDIFEIENLETGTIMSRAFKPMPVVLNLVYENFKVLMKWNRSLFFGISVGTLSDMIEYF